LSVRRGSASLIVGCLLILSVFALRLFFDADEQQTRFLGRPIGTACWFKARFGIPCPNCGMSRSAILASRGEIHRAARIAPGGPALVICFLTIGVAVTSLGAIQRWGRASQVLRAQSAARVVVIAGGSLAASVWFGGWIVEVARCLRQR
jgi:hypothetical protein